MLKTIAVATALTSFAFAAQAKPTNVNTPADTIHPNIHSKVGTGANANPNGANANGGNIHGIANNPGQSGADPSDGAPGFADQLETVHGGIGSKNKNAD
ncbi:MAG: hypothetical protein GKR99_05125 [Rhodobacteraceae bacterium]|nr:hypothetical protein [Paracoccaceae bacterium]